MNWTDRLALFSPLDFTAVVVLFALWLLIGWQIENPTAKHLSVSRIMAGYRHEWMRQMITRQPRIFDAQTISTLRQATSFFASTSMIALGAVQPCRSGRRPHLAVTSAFRLGNQIAAGGLLSHQCLFEIRLVQPPVWLLLGADGGRAK